MATKTMQHPQDIRSDMEDLVNLFLSPDFKPLKAEEDSVPNLRKMVYESDILEDDIEELSGDELPFKHNDYFHKKCGQALARLGDDFMKDRFPADSSSVNPVEKVKKLLEDVAYLSSTSTDEKVIEQEKEKAWETFKCVMDNSTSDSGVKDAYRVFGAFLVTIRGLSNLGSAVRSLVRIFSFRYIHEKQLDKDIEKMGGLNNLMKQELD